MFRRVNVIPVENATLPSVTWQTHLEAALAGDVRAQKLYIDSRPMQVDDLPERTFERPRERLRALLDPLQVIATLAPLDRRGIDQDAVDDMKLALAYTISGMKLREPPARYEFTNLVLESLPFRCGQTLGAWCATVDQCHYSLGGRRFGFRPVTEPGTRHELITTPTGEKVLRIITDLDPNSKSLMASPLRRWLGLHGHLVAQARLFQDIANLYDTEINDRIAIKILSEDRRDLFGLTEAPAFARWHTLAKHLVSHPPRIEDYSKMRICAAFMDTRDPVAEWTAFEAGKYAQAVALWGQQAEREAHAAQRLLEEARPALPPPPTQRERLMTEISNYRPDLVGSDLVDEARVLDNAISKGLLDFEDAVEGMSISGAKARAVVDECRTTLKAEREAKKAAQPPPPQFDPIAYRKFMALLDRIEGKDPELTTVVQKAVINDEVPFDIFFKRAVFEREIIAERIQRLKRGLLGDVKPVGTGLWEFRIHVAGGIRVYFTYSPAGGIVLLNGGTKATQDDDIIEAELYREHYREHKTTAPA